MFTDCPYILHASEGVFSAKQSHCCRDGSNPYKTALTIHVMELQELRPEMFQTLYRFAHVVAREEGRRFVSKPLAIQAWRLVLQGRFQRLEDWCCFVASSQQRAVTEDTWHQVLCPSWSTYSTVSTP